MNTLEIVAALDQEITRLQKARAMLSVLEPSRRPGRPKGSTKKLISISKNPKKRTMSDNGKARIAAAQKARWAAQKKVGHTAQKTATLAKKVTKLA